MTYQPIYDIAPLCFEKNVRHVVLCPGSRCAPLTLAFTRFKKFTIHVISDERSAAFIALGLAQQTKQPVVLICTSGSAVYNFAPAVAEAFFAGTPLLILSADRPAEWIGQHDGQTIFQQHIFNGHVKASYQLPQEYAHADAQWSINRIVNEALNTANNHDPGPVHINAPFREPLYPAINETINFTPTVRNITQQTQETHLSEISKQAFLKHWNASAKVLIVCGQYEHNLALTQLLRYVSEKHSIPVIADILSNQHGIEKSIQHADTFLAHAPDQLKQSLQPELLITFGKSIISKQVKLFLRKHKALHHWHIQTGEKVADTYQSLTNTVHVSPETFFSYLSTLNGKESFDKQREENYYQLWQVEESRSLYASNSFFPQQNLGEFEVVKEVLAQLPAQCHLHLSNSMSVRYANYIGLSAQHTFVQVHSNRGTSGIDGCTSTVVGHCLADPETINVLITGDIAFFYDRNAFWHNYALPNLRIVLLNNHGGVIFNLIDGPAGLQETEEYFVTNQRLSAKNLCQEYGFEHLALDSRKKLKNYLKNFFENDAQTKILEVESDTFANKTIFEEFKKKIKERYES